MKYIVSAASAAFLMLAPALAFAQDSNSNTQNKTEKTECQGRFNDAFESLPEKCKAELQTWTMAQADTNVDVDGNFVVGAVIPDTVTIVNVPDSDTFGIAMVNKKRMLVNRKDRTVIHVY
ncbi:MAG: DUF1236 domain-containing protein [Candidatus Sumerlaeaceae bacterium]|nr:DUF1236 domain-containing protein [Candidatus Sumerlaeaceae bacterium]